MASEEAESIKLTILGLSGEALAEWEVQAGHTVGSLKRDLALSFFFPVFALKLLEDGEEPGNGLAFRAPPLQRSLTCIFTAAPPSQEVFLRAVAEGQHSYIEAVLRAASAEERRRLLLGDAEQDRGALGVAASCRSLEVAEVLVGWAEEDGILQECLLRTHHFDLKPLHFAAEQSPEQVELLLAAAARQNCCRRLLTETCINGQHALHFAADKGKLEAVEALLAAAKEEGLAQELLAVQDCDRDTPLHVAAFHGHAAVLQRLLAAAEGEVLLKELLEMETGTGETLRELAERNPETRQVVEEAVQRVASEARLTLEEPQE